MGFSSIRLRAAWSLNILMMALKPLLCLRTRRSTHSSTLPASTYGAGSVQTASGGVEKCIVRLVVLLNGDRKPGHPYGLEWPSPHVDRDVDGHGIRLGWGWDVHHTCIPPLPHGRADTGTEFEV